MKKYYKYAPVALLLLLFITNPSMQAFKEYLGTRSSIYSLKRANNFFICSLYKQNSRRYIGLFGNFLDLGYNSSNYNLPGDTVAKDTTKQYDEFGILIRKKNK